MIPIEKFNLLATEWTEQELALVEYIKSIESDCSLNCEYPPRDNYIDIFIRRYNNNEIEAEFTYNDYKKDKEIQETINKLGIDPERFWYLLSFSYDFSHGYFIGKMIEKSPLQELQDFVNAIKDNIKEKNITIQLNIKDSKKKTYYITKKQVIELIMNSCVEKIEKLDNDEEFIVFEDGTKSNIVLAPKNYENRRMNFATLKEKTEKEDRARLFAYSFSKILSAFFKNNQQFVKKKKRNINDESLSTRLLIYKLVKLIKIPVSEKFKDDSNSIDYLLRDYRRVNITNIYMNEHY